MHNHTSTVLKNLSEAIKKNSLDVFWSEDGFEIEYLTRQRVSYGLFLASASCQTLFVDGRYYEVVKKKAQLNVKLLSKTALQEWFAEYTKKDSIKIGFSGDKLSYSRVNQFKDMIAQTLSKPQLQPTSLLDELRSSKTSDEIALMKESSKVCFSLYQKLKKSIDADVTEKQLVKKIQDLAHEADCDGLSFDPIIAFGKNTSMPHYHPSDTPIQEGDPILIDMGVLWKGYASDMTRVISLKTMPKKVAQYYGIIQEAYLHAKSVAKVGTALGEVDCAVRTVLKSYGVEKYFVHSTGHGIGLEVHEPYSVRSTPTYEKTPISEGMCFTIEPGLYLPNEFGVRYENTLVIEKGSAVSLMDEEL